MSTPMKVPPDLAAKAIEHDGRRFLLIQAAVFVEVEASDTAGAPSLVDGMVVFHDTAVDPVVDFAAFPQNLGIHLPNGQTAVMLPWLCAGTTVEEQMNFYREQCMREWGRVTQPAT